VKKQATVNERLEVCSRYVHGERGIRPLICEDNYSSIAEDARILAVGDAPRRVFGVRLAQLARRLPAL
jgi:hypothetical protein